MPPNSEYQPLRSTIGVKNAHKGSTNRDLYQWFEEKRAVEGAEGLWRVHDSIYDLTDFVQKHPGGKFWLETTKGTDVTEAFESHHISTKAEEVLKKYYLREAKTERSSPYLFKEDGFYRTLKRAVREELQKLPKDLHRATNNIIDCLFVVTILCAIFTNIFWSYALAVMTGILGGFLVTAAHTYCHQRDNFRMYYMDAFMASVAEFRIAHVLSHHLYTNTIADIQAYSLEPFLVYFPEKKSWMQKYGSVLYAPLLWPLAFPLGFILKWVMLASSLAKNAPTRFQKTYLIPFILPTLMYYFSNQSIWATIYMWFLIEGIASFTFAITALTMGHFHPDIFLDGDAPRSGDNLDWGICQLDAIGERNEITGNLLIVLVLFGDHVIHHLFPTLDVHVLQHLYPVVERVMKDFNLKIRWMNQTDMYKAYLRRVASETPNPNPPDLHKVLL